MGDVLKVIMDSAKYSIIEHMKFTTFSCLTLCRNSLQLLSAENNSHTWKITLKKNSYSSTPTAIQIKFKISQYWWFGTKFRHRNLQESWVGHHSICHKDKHAPCLKPMSLQKNGKQACKGDLKLWTQGNIWNILVEKRVCALHGLSPWSPPMDYRTLRNMPDWSILCDTAGGKWTILSMASNRFRAERPWGQLSSSVVVRAGADTGKKSYL